MKVPINILLRLPPFGSALYKLVVTLNTSLQSPLVAEQYVTLAFEPCDCTRTPKLSVNPACISASVRLLPSSTYSEVTCQPPSVFTL